MLLLLSHFIILTILFYIWKIKSKIYLNYFSIDARQQQSDTAFSLAASALPGNQQLDANIGILSKQLPEKKDAPSQPITNPGDVSQSTAIADRPKVKPVSKKDGKYINKKSTVKTALQQQNINQAQVIY